MQRLLNAGGEELILWIAGLAVLLAVVAFALSKLRGVPAQHEPPASELMSKLRESRARGDLSDEEFRTIKTALGERLQQELRGDGETG